MSEEVKLRGGRNLLPQSGNFTGKPSHFWIDNGGGLVFDDLITHNGYGTIKTSLGSGITGEWLKLENGVEYTYSVLIRSVAPFEGTGDIPLHFHAGKDNQNQYKITIIDYMTSYTSEDIGRFKKLWMTFKLRSDADSFRPFLFRAVNGDVNVAYLKLEKGNRATDWTPAPEDLGLDYPNHVTHFGTYFEEDMMMTDEIVEFPEELRGGRNLLTGTSEEEQEVKTSSWSIGSWNPSLTIGEEYTFSFDIKSENATYLQNVFLNNSNNGFIPNTPILKEWTRVSFTFKWKGGTYYSNEFAPHVYPKPDYSGTYVSRIKLEKGTKATDWTPSPEDLELVYPDHITHFGTYFKESDMLEENLIGGRNLIPNSKDERFDGSGREFKQYVDLAPILEKYGLDKTYSLSLEMKSLDPSISNSVQVYMQNGSGTKYNFVSQSVAVTKEFQRFIFEGLTPTLTGMADTRATLAFYGSYDTGNFPIVRNVKLEVGDRATPWTPAPEDLGLNYPPSITYFEKNPQIQNVVSNEFVEFHKDDRGLDLRNPVDKISGEEIFTDKADDSVVHVGIDGRSVGGDNSSKNLSPDLRYWNTGNGATVGVNTATIPVGGSINLVIPWDGSTGQVRVGYDVVSGSSILVGFTYLGADKTTHIMDVNNLGSGNGYTHALTPGTRGTSYGYYTIDDKVKYVRVSISGSPSYVSEPFTIKNISVKSEGYEYEPPVPYPEHPSHIHSLNDFDVVSSVDGRNYFVIKDLTPKPYPLVGNDHEYTYSLKPNTTYIIRTWNTKGASFRVNGLTVSYSTTGDRGYKVTTDSSGVLRIGLYASAGETDQFIDGSAKLKLEEGSIATDWTPAPEDITEDTNHPLIDKINLLLDEPLRSVGDVKDRLFRDSDGLWKVERNVKEAVLTSGFLKYGGPSYKEENNYTTFQISIPGKKLGFNTSRMSHLKNLDKKAQWDSPRETGYTDHGSISNIYLYMPNDILGLDFNEPNTTANPKMNSWAANNPITLHYILDASTIETLDQELQDKLNNLRSFQDSNYIYTISNNEGVPEDVKPMIHATFKSEHYGELAKDGLVYPDDITHLTTQVKYGTMVVSELIEGGGAYGDSTTRV